MTKWITMSRIVITVVSEARRHAERRIGYSSSMSIAWPIPPATHIDSIP
jgi:hypothetical protein